MRIRGRGQLRAVLALAAFGAIATVSAHASAEFTRFKWKAQDQPPVRDEPGFAYDATRNRHVLVGGTSTAGALSDVWEWTGTSWVSGAPILHPAARGSASMIYDTENSRIGMFGGSGASTYDDTWLWNGSSWLNPQPAKAPPARSYAALSYDSTRKKWVLHGGLSSTGKDLTDTWEFTLATNTWVELFPAVVPPVRSLRASIFDSSIGKTILFGGAFILPDTEPMWEWDGSTWTERGDLAKMPGFGGASFVYDAKRDRIIKFGGTLATYSNDTYEYKYGDPTWTLVAPAHKPAETPGRASYDPVRERVLLYQGFTSELWEWDGTDWTHRGPGLSPAKRGLAASTYDSDRKKVVLFGGAIATPFTDTWEWDGGSWNERTPVGASPPGSVFSAFSYDSKRKESVLLAGGTGETWTWNGAAWTQKSTAMPFLGGMGTAYDSVRDKTFLFGGYDTTQFPFTFTSDTWQWDGTTWSKIATAHAPQGRWLHGMAFDVEHQKTVIFGGAFDKDDSIFTDETWLFDGTDWVNANPTHHPSARDSVGMTYDPTRKAVILFAGKTPAVSSELWKWDGTDWVLLEVDPTPVVNAYGVTFSFDGNTLMAFGTASRLNSAATLLLVPKTEVCTQDSECSLGTYCVDGVCCGSKACNACETCNGLSPGTCSPIFNDEDPDSCAATDGKKCDGRGACLGDLGSACTEGVRCSSGNCVDGVCCDTKCDGTCVACAANLKEENARGGLCGAAKSGTDPKNQCDPASPTTCGSSGLCDGHGACGLYSKGTVCDTAAVCTGVATASARVCDGLGTCSNDAQPLECNQYRCVASTGCPTGCTTDTQCVDGFLCRNGACVIVKVGCERVEDCAAGFVCSFDGQCIAPPPVENVEGCSVNAAPDRRSLWLVPLGMLVTTAIRRKRRRAV